MFYCDNCHKPVCNEESIDAVAKLFEKEGSNAWFDRPAADILPEGFTCPHCGGKHFTQETDTLDGWFDSGSTHVAAMQRDQGFWPADMYIEGGDQYRGWFQSSLLVAAVQRDQQLLAGGCMFQLVRRLLRPSQRSARALRTASA